MQLEAPPLHDGAATRAQNPDPVAKSTGLLSTLLAARPGDLQCHVACRAELRDSPVWRSTFTALRKDHRYYEIIEDTLQDRFDYKYFIITDATGETLAIQPFFVMDQDMLEGVAGLSRPLAAIRKLAPRFLTMRTLMVGCSAGEGHLATSPRISAAEIGKVLAANITRHAKTLKAGMVVMKESPQNIARRWILWCRTASHACRACPPCRSM